MNESVEFTYIPIERILKIILIKLPDPKIVKILQKWKENIYESTQYPECDRPLERSGYTLSTILRINSKVKNGGKSQNLIYS